MDPPHIGTLASLLSDFGSPSEHKALSRAGFEIVLPLLSSAPGSREQAHSRYSMKTSPKQTRRHKEEEEGEQQADRCSAQTLQHLQG